MLRVAACGFPSSIHNIPYRLHGFKFFPEINFWRNSASKSKNEVSDGSFQVFLDCPADGQRKFQPLRRKTGKRTEVFGREKLRKYSLSIGYYYDSIWPGKPEPGGLPSDLFGGANPPDERKEGDANECYIFGLVPDVTFHCCPCQSVSSDFQGKEISRHYCE